MVSVMEISIVSLNSAPDMSLRLGGISNGVKAGSGTTWICGFQKVALYTSYDYNADMTRLT